MENISSFELGEDTLYEIDRQEREVLAKDYIENSIIKKKTRKNNFKYGANLSSRLKVATQRQSEKKNDLISRNKRAEQSNSNLNITSIDNLLETNSFDRIDFSSWEKSILNKISPAKNFKDNNASIKFKSEVDFHKNFEIIKTPNCEMYDDDNVTFMLPRQHENINDANNASLFIEKELISKKIDNSFHNSSILNDSRKENLLMRDHYQSLIIDLKKDLRYLKNWNLPETIINEYLKKGIEEMFDWQSECLQNHKVLFEGANLVYSAPTSAGKTFVSEILMIKNIVERRKKALFVLPFVSVVREKIITLQELFRSSGIKVDGYFGGYQPPGRFESFDLIICTIEKANSIINRLLEQNRLRELGLVVIDEIHLINDPSRGYILELMLTKILFMSQKYNYKLQLIGMSATLPNVDLLCKWLKSELYITNYRPINLNEMIKIEKTIYDCTMRSIRQINNKWSEYFENDTDDICELAMETIIEKYQLIIFCPSKEWCEQLCTNFAKGIHKILKHKTEILKDVFSIEKIEALLKQGKSLATGLDRKLETCLKYGVAFHHAGLTTDERDLIEIGFKTGILKLLIATSTLSSGVNLPARRVIIRTPMFGPSMMNNLTYRQMIGRAGRKGQDTEGESILVCNSSNSSMGKKLISVNTTQLISSCLNIDNYAHLKRAILEIIASNIANTREDVELFINNTLYCQEHEIDFSYFKNTTNEEFQIFFNGKKQKKVNDMNTKTKVTDRENDDPVKNSMKFLLEYEFIRIHYDEIGEMKFVPTRLGMACLSSSMPPKDGFMLLTELQRAQQNFVLECDLHAIYLVTPFSVAYQLQQIDWTYFIELYDKLPEMMKRVGKMVGVSDTFLIKAITGRQNVDWHAQQVHKRFYTALALQELVNEQPITAVSNKYKIPRGLLQSLQQSASSFAAILTAFCRSLQWDLLVLILKQFRERLYFGIHPDLIDLMKISSISSTRIARALYNNGVHDLTTLANSKKHQIEDILLNVDDSSSSFFFVFGKGLNLQVDEYSKLLISDAREFVQNELGIKDIKWNAIEEKCQKDSKDRNQFKSPNIEVLSMKRYLDKSTEKDEQQKLVSTPVVKKICFDTSLQYKKKLRSSIEKISNAVKNQTNENSSLFKNSNIILSQIEPKNEVLNYIDTEAILDDNVIFENFIEECQKQTHISLSIGLAKVESKSLTIGGNLLNKEVLKSKNLNFMLDETFYVSCMSFMFDFSNKVYYMDLQNSNIKGFTLSVKDLLKCLFKKKDLTLSFYESRPILKVISKVFEIEIDDVCCKIFDTKLASWILNPDSDLNWKEIIAKFASNQNKIFENLNQVKTLGISLGLNQFSNIDPKSRSVSECYLVKEILKGQMQAMENTHKLFKVLENLEVPIQRVLAKMEIHGFPVNVKKLQDAIERSLFVLKKLENYIFRLNGGKKFNLTSSKEIAKVLGILQNQAKKKISTAKNVLAKIDLPISNSIMVHRTLLTTISNIQSMTKLVKDDRIYSSSFSFTQTGRISMHEPNIQNVTKSFTVEYKDENDVSYNEKISFRSVFECKSGKILLSADFCQLEIRILTHLSKDPKLIEIMKLGEEDIFRKIAAKWNRIDGDSVTEAQRNQTKQLCYGIIYGMGSKTLSEKMNVDEETSLRITEDFHKIYPYVRRYTESIVKKTKEKGYIETVTCRRRYLPAINSENFSERSKAERQALNSTIQGSASDLVKNAILRMEKNLKKANLSHYCKLVMHLHDELYYEVDESHWKEIAKILVNSMENGVALNVPLPVKLKLGKNWGDMKEIDKCF